MMQCVNHDPLKLGDLGKLNVMEFLTYLQYAKQKGEIEIFEASLKQ